MEFRVVDVQMGVDGIILPRYYLEVYVDILASSGCMKLLLMSVSLCYAFTCGHRSTQFTSLKTIS